MAVPGAAKPFVTKPRQMTMYEGEALVGYLNAKVSTQEVTIASYDVEPPTGAEPRTVEIVHHVDELLTENDQRITPSYDGKSYSELALEISMTKYKAVSSGRPVIVISLTTAMVHALSADFPAPLASVRTPTLDSQRVFSMLPEAKALKALGYDLGAASVGHNLWGVPYLKLSPPTILSR